MADQVAADPEPDFAIPGRQFESHDAWRQAP